MQPRNAGVLVTRAGPGFVQAVAELALGYMVDLSRGVSRATADYQAGRKVEARMGRQLAGSKIGIIGYGSIGRYLAEIAKVMRMEVLVADPFATSATTRSGRSVSTNFSPHPTMSSASRSPTSRPRI